MNKYLKLIYLLLLFSFTGSRARAQADYGSEEEFKKQAAKLFNEEEYVKAYPLYTQLVSLYRKDPDYNYRLGVCMLYATDDKEKAILYLEFALRTPDEVEKEACFYLAKAYHLNYRFDDAIAKYKAYKKIASGAKAERLQVDRQIEMCANGKRLLQNITDLMVIEKIEMNREDFFRAYDISGIGGKLLVKPDEKEFKTALDKKKKENSIIYLAQNGSQIYFSSYGDNEQNGKDIYLIKKLPSGEWGKPQAVGKPINTKYDEDYPFLHPDGKTLYFCSKGHNSMGGYDIFKTTLNEETNEWSAPVNLDFPVNTPDDDILYITDKEDKQAYFSSGRASVAGKMAVYHINVARKPIDFVMINGAVVKNRPEQALNAKITIKDINDNNAIVGMLNSKAENGAYDIKLSNGGRFLYTVETPGFAIQSEVVEIPVQKEFRPLKQEISYESGSDKLVIKNLFDAPPADTSYLLALNLIKEKAKLDVRPTTTDVVISDSVKEDGSEDTSVAVVQPVTTTSIGLSNEDIVRIAYRDAKEAETEANELREQADISWGFANQKNGLAQGKLQEAANLMAAAAKEEDIVKKQALTEQANTANKEAEQLNDETVVAFNIAKKIDATATANQEEAELSQQYAKELEAAVKSSNSKQSVAKLEELEKKLDALSQTNAASLPITNSFKREEENKKREMDKAIQESGNLKQDMADNEIIIAGLKVDAAKEKNDKIKEGLNNQIAELQQENIDKQKQYEQNEMKIARLQKEYAAAKNEMELVGNVVDQSKTADGEAIAAKSAAIDKNKLEQQINTIKNSTAANNSSIAQSTSATEDRNNKNVVASTNNQTKADSAPQHTMTVVTTSGNTMTIDTTERTVDLGKPIGADTVKQFAYTNADANTQITEADSLDKEANDLLAQSITYRVETRDQTSKSAQRERRKQGEELVKRAQAKKEKSAQLYADANKAEYSASQKPLDEAAKANAGSTAPELFKAELLNDESKKYFDLAQQERERTKSAKSYSEKEAAYEAAKSNELIALEKQKEAAGIYKNYKPDVSGTSVASINIKDTSKAKTTPNNGQTIVTNNTSATTPHTTESAIADINTKYQADLAATESIKDEADREKAKADVLKSWSEALDVDLVKQKQDYEAATDPVVKAQLAKRMSDVENSSKEKQALASQSKTKAEDLKQQSVAATTSSANADNTTVAKNQTNDSNRTGNNNNGNSNSDSNVLADSAGISTQEQQEQFEYNDPVANEKIAKAVVLNDQADELLAQSIIPELETTEKISDAERAKRKKEAQKLIAEAQKKKTESAQLVASANSSEYSSKQKELDKLAKVSEESTAPELLKAEITNDEAQKHYNLASNERKKAEKTNNYYEKEMLLDDARENELMALKKQKEALDIYKNYNSGAVVTTTTNNNNNTIASNNTINNNSTSNGTNNNIPTNSNSTGITAANPDNAATTTTDNASVASEKSINTTTVSNKQFAYTLPSALEQSVKAAALNKQAEDIMTLSLDLKTQAIAQSNTDAKNTMYAQSEELMKEAHGKKTEAAQLMTSANAAEYKHVQDQLDKYAKAASANNSGELLKAEILNDEAQANFKKAKAQRDEAAATDSYFAREAIVEDAYSTEITALEKQNEAVTIYKKYSPEVASVNTTKSATSATSSASTIAANPKTVSYDVVLASNEAFEQKSGTVYSSKNPIPIDQKLPEGLIFKVQIGAFRKPIPQNLFKGITPITGERTSKGFIRYTAGVFTKFSTADKVKKKIIDMGYKDAFVVAFLNGKRIPINEAYALAEGTPATVLQVSQQPDNSQNTTATSQQNEIVKSQSVADVGGLFYTVQVGVFSQPVLASKLYSMSPLYSEKSSNGYLRYYTGIYKSAARASEAKDMVVDIGIKDAFVTAYYNGKRVSIPEAQKYEAQGAVFPTSPEVNKLPSFKAVTKSSVPQRNKDASTQQPADKATKQQLNTATSQNNNFPAGTGIVYKVQIGAFYDEVPLDMANKFLKIAHKGILNYKDNSGMTIYTVGNFKTYDEANALKAEVAAEELTDAFVVAYRDGQKISIEEAKQSTNTN